MLDVDIKTILDLGSQAGTVLKWYMYGSTHYSSDWNTGFLQFSPKRGPSPDFENRSQRPTLRERRRSQVQETEPKA